MARHGIALEITPLKSPTRLTTTGFTIAHVPQPPILKRSTPMQHSTIIKHNRFALAQLMRIHSSGCLDERGDAPERVVELVRRVEREGRLERRAVVHGSHSKQAIPFVCQVTLG